MMRAQEALSRLTKNIVPHDNWTPEDYEYLAAITSALREQEKRENPTEGG